MPNGQSPKLKAALCNIPIDVVDVSNTLPRPADSNGIIIVKLKQSKESYSIEDMFILNL